MVTPTDYDVTITVNAVDVTAYIPWQSMSIDDYPRQVSSFRFTVESPSGVTPSRGHEVIVTANSVAGTPVEFLGYIIEVRTKKHRNGINVFYECEAADRKILLQRSVLDVESLTGSDLDIIGSLLGNAYPDLSSYFDFSSGVNEFATGLDLPTGNDNLLEALNNLSDLTGGEYSFQNVSTAASIIEEFDGTDFIATTFHTRGDCGTGSSQTGAYEELRVGFSAGACDSNTLPLSDQPALDTGGNGNPGNCASWTPVASGAKKIWSSSGGFNQRLEFLFNPYASGGSDVAIDDLTFDYYIHSDIVSTIFIRLTFADANVGTLVYEDNVSLTGDTWTSISAASHFTQTSGTPTSIADIVLDVSVLNHIKVDFRTSSTIDISILTVDIRLDNLVVDDGSSGAPETQLLYDDAPPAADFNINVDTSDEFAFDIEFSEGDWDDFNSITVVGGNQETAIDWTYPNFNGQVHINLEADIDDIVVYKNTGSEGSPTWTLQTDGVLGTDELGGSIDVVYDKVDHWLYFNTAPSNFYDAVRVTGTIRIPIRVRVENITSGDPTYATVLENPAITSVEQALAFGESKLAARNAIKTLTFETHEPGLKTGQQITVTDTDRGLAESLVIQNIKTKWLSGKTAQFSIECGTDEISSVDATIAENRNRNTDLNAGATVVTYQPVLDVDNAPVTDAYGRLVFGVT